MTNVEKQVSENKGSVKLSLGVRCKKGSQPCPCMKAQRGFRSIASLGHGHKSCIKVKIAAFLPLALDGGKW